MSFTPYNIQDWLRRTPAVPVRRRNTYIEVPAFNYTGLVWKGASECVAQFNFSASNKFTLITLPTKPTGANFGLCIRYRIGEIVYRFKLWDDEAFKLTGDVPIYTNEIIRANFVIEVWSYENETTAVNEEALRTITSVRVLPTDVSQLGVNAALAVGAEFRDLDNVAATLAAPSSGLVYQFAADVGLVSLAGNVVSWANQLGETLLPVGGNVGYTASVGAINNKPSVNFASNAVGLENLAMTAGISATFGLLIQQSNGYVAGTNIIETYFGSNPNVTLIQNAISPEIEYNGAVINDQATLNSWIIIIINYTTNEAVTEYYTNMNVYSVNSGILIAAAQSTSVFPPSAAQIDGLKLGNASVAGSLFSLAELLIYNVNPVGLEASIVNYLATKYGSAGAIALPLTFNTNVQWLDNDN